jgi:type VI secretion system secreted protein VgrG
VIDVAFRIVQEQYPELDYCVQYEESALDFVSRLMEHLGMFYWHEHAADRHVLVIGDRNDATNRCDPASVTVSPNPQRGEVQTLDFRSVFRPGKWTLNDYDFHSPTKRLLVHTPTTLDVPRMLNHEIYRWAGAFTQHDDGRMLSRIRMEMEEARHRGVRLRPLCRLRSRAAGHHRHYAKRFGQGLPAHRGAAPRHLAWPRSELG